MAFAPALLPSVERRLKDINPKYRAVWNSRREVWEIRDRTSAGANYIVTFARQSFGTLVPITRDKELQIDLYEYLRRGEWFRRMANRDFRYHLDKFECADETRQELIDRHEQDMNKQFGREAYRAFNMWARDMGYDQGKVKIPTIQPGVDILSSGAVVR